MKSFNKIYIVNLHGSTMRNESTEEVVDQCVFDIRQGVSIVVMVKTNGKTTEELAKVYYKDVYGKRQQKLSFLKENPLSGIAFKELQPTAPLYTFRIVDHKTKEHYENGFKIDKLMPHKVQGFTSDKDSIALQYSRDGIERIISLMLSDKTDAELQEEVGFRDTRDWKLGHARKALEKKIQRERYITEVQYRPFDTRWTYLDKVLVTYPRPLILNSVFKKDNQVLCIGQQGNVMGDNEWSLVYTSTLPTDKNIVPRGGIYLFPMFVYDGMLKYANFSYDILQETEKRTGLTLQDVDDKERKGNGFLAIDLIDYIYAVLHSVAYRDTYHDFLQNDFPVIPYPSTADYFFKMAELGKKLRMLHAMKGIEKTEIITTYPVAATKDNNVVLTRKFEETSEGIGRVWINKDQYFDGVPSEAWNMVIAGYQPLDKWLKDRKDKHLTGEEIMHYQKMVVALVNTIRTQEEIDRMIEL